MSFFGINGAEFVVLLIVIVIVLGPQRTAQTLVWLQNQVKRLQAWSADMRAQAADMKNQERSAARELADTFAQLDPRKIIKEAVAEEMQAWLREPTPETPEGRTSAENLPSDPVAAIHSELHEWKKTLRPNAAPANQPHPATPQPNPATPQPHPATPQPDPEHQQDSATMNSSIETEPEQIP